jgi:hypothetical protein
LPQGSIFAAAVIAPRSVECFAFLEILLTEHQTAVDDFENFADFQDLIV